MNHDEFKNHWQDWRDSVGRYFNMLTADDITKIDGNYEILLKLLHERYGFSQQRAWAEFDGFMTEMGKTSPNARIDY